ncbi:hypothetical protein HJC23_011366 [Cyclotella cryptica]|uniref:RNA polymerase sigma-70 region 2 domain-containing protein n=1 Tax=Cyclotella cryptica TaxID=29204 RepID=A0ABD3PPL8_9STRA
MTTIFRDRSKEEDLSTRHETRDNTPKGSEALYQFCSPLCRELASILYPSSTESSEYTNNSQLASPSSDSIYLIQGSSIMRPAPLSSLFICGVFCSHTCHALLNINTIHRQRTLPPRPLLLLTPRSSGVFVRQEDARLSRSRNSNRSESVLSSSPDNEETKSSAPSSTPSSSLETRSKHLKISGRKRPVVRVVSSRKDMVRKDAQSLVRTKRRTATMSSPKMSSLPGRRISKSTANRVASKTIDDTSNEILTPIKISPNLASGATFQRSEMMEHTLLTKEEEFELGRRIVRARELREKIESLVEERAWETDMAELVDQDEDASSEGGEVDMDFLTYEMEYLSLYGFRPPPLGNLQEYDLEDDLLIDHAMHRSQHMSQLRNNNMDGGSSPTKATTKRNGYRNGSSSSAATTHNNSYTSLLHIPIHLLSEQDVMTLNIPGGKVQAIEILLDGAHAREMLMRKNIKLVISIAKNWMRNSFTTKNSNLGGVVENSSSTKGAGNKKRKYLSQMYEGSWDRPSLDEAVQEGVLGLARAVDKYDPERGLRFSTYATHWVTSYVRVCFQRAVTGCLRVPSQLHDIKSAYKRIIKDHLQASENPPAMKSIAKELGITEHRLVTAIRATESLVSVDAPIVFPGSGSYKGSAAGGDGSNQELLILDTLSCAEPKPEDQVEVSFLRQCLENAMATELTPYERDILRLRLGLDSGEGKTVRQIVDMCGGSLTTADVRAAERRAFKKLRSPSSVHTHNLLAYLDMSGTDRDFILRR